jgi:hypothetical protein
MNNQSKIQIMLTCNQPDQATRSNEKSTTEETTKNIYPASRNERMEPNIPIGQYAE